MKKIALVILISAAGFTANAQQTKPKQAVKKAGAKTELKKETCKSGMSCCKNEKALSALRRPTKPVATDKKSK